MGQAGDDSEDRGRSVKVNLFGIITSAVLHPATFQRPAADQTNASCDPEMLSCAKSRRIGAAA